jgi:hypothetical protein
MTNTETTTTIFTKDQAKASDAVHADLQTAAYKAEDKIAYAVDTLHRAVNDDYKIRFKAKSGWKLTDQEAFDKAVELGATADNDYGYDAASKAANAVKNYRELRAALADAKDAVREHSHEWLDHGQWSRFFLVTGGHIHSSTGCHTLYPTTRIGWLPALSGETEAEAVAAHGAMLCTVCFPSAPVEWTDGRKGDEDQYCAGGGTWDYPAETARKGYCSGNYGVCNHCGEKITISSTGKMRKHKKAK